MHHKAVLLITKVAWQAHKRTQATDQTGCDLPPPPPSSVLLAERERESRNIRKRHANNITTTAGTMIIKLI